MKPEAQRIAIAEACPDKVEWHDGIPYWKGSWSAVGEGNESFAEFDPLNDLNAIHEAEKTLTRVQRVKFVTELCGLVGVKWKPTSHFDTIHATAAQRAEAFLRTIGKWEDDK